MGGVLNAARYISNEGWWLKKENTEVIPDSLSSTYRTDQMASNTVTTTKSGHTDTVSSQWHLPADDTNVSSSVVEKSNKSSMETGVAN
jgi:hypothetical protein